MPGWRLWDVARYHAGPNHMSKEGCPCIAYAYFVERDGAVFKCLPHDARSWHVGPWNERSIGVCLAYDGGALPPSDEQLAAAADLCAALVSELGLDPNRVLGHRELPGTGYTTVDGKVVERKECPGKAIDMSEFRSQVARAARRHGGPSAGSD
jgi:N-acetyl-anhydromuramyl-L-alanine amidase AmpD